MIRSRLPRLLAWCALSLATISGRAGGQVQNASRQDACWKITPGSEYHAGTFGRKVLGEGWRTFWLTPVCAPPFDMGTYAGGLMIESRGGGRQTRSLHFKEVNGPREF